VFVKIHKTTAMKKVTIEQLAELMNKKVWAKNGLKRIYLNDAGYNTKKMTTKAFIFQNEDGKFCVSVSIDCPSQSFSWIKSQQDKVRGRIEKEIDEAIAEVESVENDTIESEAESVSPSFDEDLEKMKSCTPVPIEYNKHYAQGRTPVRSVASLSDTDMIDFYKGCGKGLAYVRDKKVIAFQYGNKKPGNAPVDCIVCNVSFSCTDICFNVLF
jgi:hypothetical protein